MDFTLKQLRYFVAAAEAGGLTAASRELAVSQPSLSAAIGQLEARFGVQLFLRRKAQGLSLTPSGRFFLLSARRLLEHAEEVAAAGRGLGGELDGPLEVGCFVTLAPFFLPRLLKAVSDRQPGVEVGIREAGVDGLKRALHEGAIELALLYDLDLDDRLETEALAAVPPMALLPPDSPLAARERVSLAELAELPMIQFDLPHSREYFRSLFLAAGLDPIVRYRSASFEMVRSLVANGLGYSLLSLRPAGDRCYDGSRLVVRPLDAQVQPVPIMLARVRGARLTRRAEAFAEICRELLAASSVVDGA